MSVGFKNPEQLKIDFPKKSFWRDRTRRIWSFYCPLCHVPRKIPYQPRPGLTHMAQIGLTSLILMLAGWNRFEWKGIVVFLPLWMFFEIAYRTRVRAALACSQCGFDPYLYLIDVQRAREVVENHWRKKFAEKGIPYPEKSNGAQKGAKTSQNAQQPKAKPESDAPAKSSSAERNGEMVT
jgi:hypothetical protein